GVPMSVDHAPMAPVVPLVQRWTRFQHDRAYVSLGDQELGYRDLKTGEVCCPVDGEPELVKAATADLYARVREKAAAAAYVPKHADPRSEVRALPGHSRPGSR